LAFFGGVFGFFMFWQSGNPDNRVSDWSFLRNAIAC